MLVIDTVSRHKCDRIVRSLKGLFENCNEQGQQYFFRGCPRSLNQQSNPVENKILQFPRPFMDSEEMRSSKATSFGRFGTESTFMVASGSSKNHFPHRIYNIIDKALASKPARQTSPLARKGRPLERIQTKLKERHTIERAEADTPEDADDEEEPDEETFLLAGPSGDLHEDTHMYMTASPEAADRPTFASDFGGAFLASDEHTTDEMIEPESGERGNIDEDDISLSGAPLLESPENDVANSTPSPATTGESSISNDGESSWRRAKELLRGLRRWLQHWLGCIYIRVGSRGVR